jgi:hypothetical protein
MTTVSPTLLLADNFFTSSACLIVALETSMSRLGNVLASFEKFDILTD